jgi:hypothetical protein
MRVAVDIDGTLNAAPEQFVGLLSAIKGAGYRVSVVTGASDNPVTQQTFDDKANFLNELGLGQCYDDMTVISSVGDLAQKKAKWCVDQSVDILIDNSIPNAKAAVASGIPLVLVPWASRVK